MVRIRPLPDAEQSNQAPRVREWARSRRGGIQFLLFLFLGITLATTFGLWYNLGGYRALQKFLLGTEYQRYDHSGPGSRSINQEIPVVLYAGYKVSEFFR